jgi:CheY-like chemotaxis protein
MDKQEQNRSVVLVVEDDELLLADALEVVSQAGFEPVPAKNADDAIMILERRNDIRVIFSDVNMPGSIDGLKLVHIVRNRWPPIEIIVTSGFNLDSEHILPDRGIFVPKPYTPAQIASALHGFVSR